MRKAFYVVLFLLILSVIINVLLWVRPQALEETEERTETKIDTIKYRQPVPVDSFVIHYITEEIPVNNNDSTDNIVSHEEAVQPEVIIKGDSASVIIPITQKVYEDSTYRAYVSGYRPSLDSIEILRYTEKVYIRAPTKQPRFSLGIQGGYGYTPKGFQPYIGVGVTVNLWSL